jgi:cytochrome bd-type quinol oxidase subunit 1
MNAYFPRHTAEWQLEEPAALRRLTLSLVEMALIAGVVIHLLRAIAFTFGGVMVLGGVLSLAAVVLLGFLAAHLANYTIRTWVWRAPLFALIEAAAEITTGALLTAVGREPLGSGERATFGDLSEIALSTIMWRLITVCVFAAILAGVVYAVRLFLIRRERTAGAAEAVRAELDAPTPTE